MRSGKSTSALTNISQEKEPAVFHCDLDSSAQPSLIICRGSIKQISGKIILYSHMEKNFSCQVVWEQCCSEGA